MLLLQQDTTNIVYFSLKDKATTGDNYLMVFINDMSKEEEAVLLDNIEDITDNLSITFIKDIQTGAVDNLSGEVKLYPTGYYTYEIYEQSNGFNLDKNDASVIGKVETGKAFISGVKEVQYTQHKDTTNTTNYMYVK